VSSPNLGFFWGVLRLSTPPFLNVLIIMVCLFLSNLAPFVRYRGYEILGFKV
jgi:hypothetical protein